jgi:hypothetical protein
MWQVIGKFVVEMIKIIFSVLVARGADWLADKIFGKSEPVYA